MTTSTSPDGRKSRRHAPLRVADPGELFAAVPALLGFPPERSLVLVCLHGPRNSRLGGVMRHDLVLPRSADGGVTPVMDAAIDRFASVCGREGVRAAVALIVDDTADHEDEEYSAACVAVVEQLAEQLHAFGTALDGAYIVEEIDEGAPWSSLWGDFRFGVLPDPAASSVAAAHVMEGRQIRRSRGELVDMLAPGDSRERFLVARAVAAGVHSAVLAVDLAEAREDPDDRSRRQLEHVLWQISNLASGERLLAPEIAELWFAVANLDVRDALLALAAGDQAEAAEQLWLRMAKLLPANGRAEAAALLGFSAYVRGEGPYAGVALTAALQANPKHRLAGMLDAALQNGMRPHTLQKLVDAGYAAARRLGVTLPPPAL
ncbi:DUF4192 domain-containing protein [Antrihabitans sp. YC2-6]|uniref:DUF4192 domain-containing protein n=1 Tax=Antrihabitans sp. YC2-6 TaxID=2799498 RepID=UPI0018F3A766|nr:DUF4192 domain-containing protein [Antrihabitans sp. YC2-6]MBJ8345047.1 DUF4192 domain-containing protein [Antrihabitans sp. YC2-6]